MANTDAGEQNQPIPPKSKRRYGKRLGRPTTYRPSFAKQARELCERGLTQQELADAFSVSTTTIKDWRAKYRAFATAVRVGKELSDERVVMSLYNRAVGYDVDALKIFPPREPGGEPLKVAYTEHCPPDPTAMIFWLKNRRPQEWRDRHVIENVNADNSLSEQDLLVQLAQQAAELGIDVKISFNGAGPEKPAEPKLIEGEKPNKKD